MADEHQERTSPQAVQAHLGIMQTVITRMASNSAYCKAWSITLVSAILVIVANKGEARYALIAIIPAFLFLVLDTYYLALEKMFRQSYNDFVEKLHSGKLSMQDLYVVTPSGNIVKTALKVWASFSVWPFYLMLLAMILLTQKLVI